MPDRSTVRKVLLLVGLVAIVLVGIFGFPAFGDSCGDWDRADAEDLLLDNSRIEEGNDGNSYEYEPGDGDYRKTGAGEFEYVGCSDSSGGSHISGGTSGGSGFRGGGPGFGK